MFFLGAKLRPISLIEACEACLEPYAGLAGSENLFSTVT
jgi:hypothetical protein